MTRAGDLTGWTVLAAALVACVLVSIRWPRRVAPIGAVGRVLTGGPIRQVAALLVWAWLGWHFFAR